MTCASRRAHGARSPRPARAALRDSQWLCCIALTVDSAAVFVASRCLGCLPIAVLGCAVGVGLAWVLDGCFDVLPHRSRVAWLRVGGGFPGRPPWARPAVAGKRLAMTRLKWCSGWFVSRSFLAGS